MALSKSQEEAIEKITDQIDHKDWLQAKKNLYLEFLHSLSPENQDQFISKRLVQWKKSSAFQDMAESQILNAMTQFRISSMVLVMMGTIVLHFLFTLFTGQYFINFSIDALVSSVCLAFLLSNLSSKYRLLKSFGVAKDYYIMDLLSVVLCILVELLVYWIGLDLSIIILIGSYYLQKRKFSYFLENKYKKSILA